MSVSIEPFVPKELGPKDWGSELLVAHTPQYTGKVMHMRAGASGPLQYHEHKDETFYLVSGRAQVTFDVGGKLVTRSMRPGQSYHIPPGAVHRVAAVTDCVMFEASTPHFEDRVNVEDRYPA
jgi:mannose-6-phosphate isomerase-like protein (cupin superfamily)